MMKRSREEVQYGARPGPGGVGGSGGGGGGGGGVTATGVVAGTANVTTGALNIGTVVPCRCWRSGGVVADSSVAGNNDGNSVTTAGAGGGSGRITQLSANTVVATSGGGPANTVVQPQTVQYSTSYNVSSIPCAAVLLKLDGPDGVYKYMSLVAPLVPDPYPLLAIPSLATNI
ncbi:hypothetical protein DOY81_012541 [Sarcophaga bullata]|nr:hypothetical protein DOY81_012541 [Sarcophaga bullata]